MVLCGWAVSRPQMFLSAIQRGFSALLSKAFLPHVTCLFYVFFPLNHLIVADIMILQSKGF